MSGIAIAFTVLTCIVIPANMVAQWLLSKGKLKFAYPMLMFVYALYITIETMLALNDPSQISILLFNIVNVWAFAMAFKGAKRLREQEKENSLEKIAAEKSKEPTEALLGS